MVYSGKIPCAAEMKIYVGGIGEKGEKGCTCLLGSFTLQNDSL